MPTETAAVMPETHLLVVGSYTCPLGRLPRLEYGRAGAVVALEEPGLHSLPCAKMPRFNSMAIVTPRRWRAMKFCAPAASRAAKAGNSKAAIIAARRPKRRYFAISRSAATN